jgi:hypothetical protein
MKWKRVSDRLMGEWGLISPATPVFFLILMLLNVFEMKKLLFLPLVALVVLSSCGDKKPVSPHESVTSEHISVRYGRPYKKGRDIFGALVPYGKVYRCGADSATTITFDKDVNFGGKPVKAGTYTLFVIPTEQSWTVILNSQLGQWGAFDYEKYKDKDVLHVDVPVKKLPNTVEQLTISLPPSQLVIEWDNVQVSVPIEIVKYL